MCMIYAIAKPFCLDCGCSKQPPSDKPVVVLLDLLLPVSNSIKLAGPLQNACFMTLLRIVDKSTPDMTRIPKDKSDPLEGRSYVTTGRNDKLWT